MINESSIYDKPWVDAATSPPANTVGDTVRVEPVVGAGFVDVESVFA